MSKACISSFLAQEQTVYVTVKKKCQYTFGLFELPHFSTSLQSASIVNKQILLKTSAFERGKK
jgi:hypothetical protein